MNYIKFFQLASIVIFLHTSQLLADVKFEFIYADEPGTGFHLNPEAKKSLEKVGKKIGRKWLKRHDAHVKIKVISKNKGTELGYAENLKILEENNCENFYHSYCEDKIIHGKANKNSEYDGVLCLNFYHKYNYKGNTHKNQTDFQSLVLHELTHLLGIISNSCSFLDYHEILLKYFIRFFIQEVFNYGINEILGTKSLHSLNDLKKDIEAIESSNIALNVHIFNDSLPDELEDLKEDLFCEFENSIKNKSKIKSSLLFKNINKYLLAHGVTFQEFIAFDLEPDELIIYLMLFGMEKVTGSDFLIPVDRQALIDNFKTFYILNKNNNDYLSKLKQGIRRLAIKEDDIINALTIVVDFASQCLINQTVNEHDAINVKNKMTLLLNQHNISLKDFPSQFSLRINSLPLNMVNVITKKGRPVFFDKFVYLKNGENFFNMDSKETERSLFLQKNKNKRLYFKGPKTMKYLGAPIPLYGQDASHVSMKNASIMSPMCFKGMSYIHEWDKYTTAMLLDLGYKIDNYWTKRWKNKKRNKKFENTIRRFEQKIRQNIKNAENNRILNKRFRINIKNKIY